MGFMDKAKQLAEQAQQKLEETQKQFNDSQAQKAAEQGGAPAEDAGRAGSARQSPVPAPSPAPSERRGSRGTRAAADRPLRSVDDNPDPFKPIQ